MDVGLHNNGGFLSEVISRFWMGYRRLLETSMKCYQEFYYQLRQYLRTLAVEVRHHHS